jgi:hypothetical protein
MKWKEGECDVYVCTGSFSLSLSLSLSIFTSFFPERERERKVDLTLPFQLSFTHNEDIQAEEAKAERAHVGLALLTPLCSTFHRFSSWALKWWR